MSFRKTFLALSLLVGFGAGITGALPAQGQDFSRVLQAFSGTVTSFDDFENRRIQLDKYLSDSELKGELSKEQATAFKVDLGNIAKSVADMKAQGKPLGFRNSVYLTFQMNTLATRIDRTRNTVAQSIGDPLEFRKKLEADITKSVSDGTLSGEDATRLKGEIDKINAVEAAFIQSSPQGLTAAQKQILVSKLEAVKADYDQELKIADSALGELDKRRVSVAERILDAERKGQLTRQEVDALNNELNQVLEMQRQFNQDNHLTGAEILKLAGEIDRLSSKVDSFVSVKQVSTIAYDNLFRDVSYRLNGLKTNRVLSERDGANYSRELDQIFNLMTAYKASAVGPTASQIEKLSGDLKDLQLRMESSAQTQVSSSPTNGVGSGIPSFPNAPHYTDLAGFWAAPYVLGLAEKGMIGGFPDGSFKPGDSITRAQFAAIAAKALGIAPAFGPTGFKDVPETYWGAKVISAVSRAGLVTGFPDGTFKPEDKITRAQALVILAKALKNPSEDYSALARYRDHDAIPGWAKPSVSKAAGAGIIVNFPDKELISPNAFANRGEVAGLFYQTLSNIGNVSLPPISLGALGRGIGNANTDAYPPTAPPAAYNPPTTTSVPSPTVTTSAPRLAIGFINFSPETGLNAGEQLSIMATGTPGAIAFATIDGVTGKLPMQEMRAGVYETNYTVKRSDNQASAKVIVELNKAGADMVTATAPSAVTIDARGPQVQGAEPAMNAILTDRMFSVIVRMTDGNGSGVDPSKVKLMVNGQDVTAQSTVSKDVVVFRTPQAIKEDNVQAELRADDKAGNGTVYRWNFKISAPPIQ